MSNRAAALAPAESTAGPSVRSSSRVQSVDRAARLLSALAAAGAPGMATVALADACGLNRATAWRILWTLDGHGFVTNDEAGVWHLGRGLAELAGQATTALRDTHTVLKRLARQTGETAALAVPRNGSLTYFDEVAAPNIVTASWTGREVSLYATSTGKALLAWSDPAEVERLLPTRLRRFTETTITARKALLADLDLARQRGYATCHGEYDPAAWGVSVPVLDRGGRLLAVLSLWGPGARVTPDRFPALGRLAIRAAAEIAPA